MSDFERLVPSQSNETTVGRWATVTDDSPLRVKIDGDTNALNFTPDTLVGGLEVSDRVWVQIVNRRLVVVSRSGGPGAGGVFLTDGDKGDITVSSSGATWTIDSDAVSNSKMANMSADTIKGRANGAGTGDPTDLSAAQVRTILSSARMGCSVARTSNQSIGSAGGSDTLIDWNSQVEDTDALFAPTSTNITIPSGGDGIWAVNVNISYSGAIGTGRAFMNLRVNTSTIYRLAIYGNGEQFIAQTWVLPLVATNVLTIGVYQSSGGALNLQGTCTAFRVSV